VFELAMTAACGCEEPAVILEHSKHLADLHQFRISGKALARGIAPLRHNDQRQRRAGAMPAKKNDADRRVRWTLWLGGSLLCTTLNMDVHP